MLDSAADARRVLQEARVIAVVGAHRERARAAWYVPDYLRSVGYRVLPVNPRFAGETLCGDAFVATLPELNALGVPVDVVEVFRRSGSVPALVPDILAMDPLPSVVWLQSGIRHDAAAARLSEAGIQVIQDRCMLADHRRFGLPPRPAPVEGL